MAKAGKTYREMLSFYYPTTFLYELSTGARGPEAEVTEEEKGMAYATVKASWLIPRFKRMVDEHWAYRDKAAEEGAVDCSGAFSLFYRQGGSCMVHGSNSIWRKYTVERGEKGKIRIVPGMAVFVHKNDGKEPTQYSSDGQGNFKHVGCYVGNGLVAEAKGSEYGCVYSRLEDKKWTHAARLKYTEYDVDEDTETGGDGEMEQDTLYEAEVCTHNGGKNVNLRTGPGKSYTVIRAVNTGTRVRVLSEHDGWYFISANGIAGYMCADYLRRISDGSAEEGESIRETPVTTTICSADGRMSFTLLGSWYAAND